MFSFWAWRRMLSSGGLPSRHRWLWVSAITFHRTVNQFNQKHCLADMLGFGREACEVKCYQMKDDDKHPLGIVPEFHHLFQVLHHACICGTDRCYVLCGLQPCFLGLLDSNQLQQIIVACLPIHHWLAMRSSLFSVLRAWTRSANDVSRFGNGITSTIFCLRWLANLRQITLR